MRAALLTGYKKNFEIGEIPDPVITHPDDVIVKVGAAGFCRTDIHIWMGQLAELHASAGVTLPFVCGHETAGWVAEVGSGVTHIAAGDAVLLHPLATCGYCAACRRGDDMHCAASTFPGIAAQGGFAEYVRSNARAVVPIPDGLTPADVAPLADAGLTAYRAVRKVLSLTTPGTVTVVLGAGGLGHIGIQALRALSQTEIIVVDRSEAALEHALGWGADHVVSTKDDGSHVTEIMDLTLGRGADVVLDYIGELGPQHDAIKVLGRNGTDVIAGYGGRLDFDILADLLTPEIHIVGSLVGSYTELVELLALTRRGAVTLTSTSMPLERINDALHALDEGRLIGRAMLVP